MVSPARRLLPQRCRRWLLPAAAATAHCLPSLPPLPAAGWL
jgi:hypothetical protein